MVWLAGGAGGALGAIARHGLNHLIHQRTLSSTFPLGIFLINVGGSVFIGVLAGVLASNRRVRVSKLNDETRHSATLTHSFVYNFIRTTGR